MLPGAAWAFSGLEWNLWSVARNLARNRPCAIHPVGGVLIGRSEPTSASGCWIRFVTQIEAGASEGVGVVKADACGRRDGSQLGRHLRGAREADIRHTGSDGCLGTARQIGTIQNRCNLNGGGIGEGASRAWVRGVAVAA